MYILYQHIADNIDCVIVLCFKVSHSSSPQLFGPWWYTHRWYRGYGNSKIIRRILSIAFPEYKIVFSNKLPPHLIIKTPEGRDKLLKWNAPYIFFSTELFNLKQCFIEITFHPLYKLLAQPPKNKITFISRLF